MHRFRLPSCLAAVALGGALALAPQTALGHEKWFTERAVHATNWDLVLSGRTALALGVGLAAVGVFALLQRLIGDPHWPRLPFFRRMVPGEMTLLAVQTAIALIYMAVRLALFAPNLTLPPSPGGFALAALEVLAAFTLITGVLDRLGAFFLLAMWLAIAGLFSPLDLLAQAHYAGIALAVLLVGKSREVQRARPPFDAPKWGARGVAALRVLAGVSFLALALADKVWNPDLGQAFLTRYPNFNVVRSLAGVDFSDGSFVLAAGVVETAIGMLLISGVLTRVVILVLLVPFNVTVPFLPAEEMIGHLPIFGILYLLLVHGAGATRGDLRDAEPRPAAAPIDRASTPRAA